MDLAETVFLADKTLDLEVLEDEEEEEEEGKPSSGAGVMAFDKIKEKVEYVNEKTGERTCTIVEIPLGIPSATYYI